MSADAATWVETNARRGVAIFVVGGPQTDAYAQRVQAEIDRIQRAWKLADKGPGVPPVSGGTATFTVEPG